MTVDKGLKLILEEMFSDDRDRRERGREKLITMGNGDPLFFIDLLNLEHKHTLVKDAAAYELRRIGDIRAFQPLLNYILNPKNIHYNGSMCMPWKHSIARSIWSKYSRSYSFMAT